MKVNLCLLRKDGTRKAFPLPSTVTTIGRRKDCDLCIPLPSISRRHCELNMDQGKLTVRDLNSQNGTFVNGSRVEEAHIKPGDELQVADLLFFVQIDGMPENLTTLQPHPVILARPSSPADVEQEHTPQEDAFEDMLKDFSGMDLNQTLDTAMHQQAPERSL